eukprot:scaffold680948_cov60-Prasinocladus_malaysianus.AAC.1
MGQQPSVCVGFRAENDSTRSSVLDGRRRKLTAAKTTASTNVRKLSCGHTFEPAEADPLTHASTGH